MFGAQSSASLVQMVAFPAPSRLSAEVMRNLTTPIRGLNFTSFGSIRTITATIWIRAELIPKHYVAQS
jgi:hypothetical protein